MISSYIQYIKAIALRTQPIYNDKTQYAQQVTKIIRTLPVADFQLTLGSLIKNLITLREAATRSDEGAILSAIAECRASMHDQSRWLDAADIDQNGGNASVVGLTGASGSGRSRLPAQLTLPSGLNWDEERKDILQLVDGDDHVEADNYVSHMEDGVVFMRLMSGRLSILKRKIDSSRSLTDKEDAYRTILRLIYRLYVIRPGHSATHAISGYKIGTAVINFYLNQQGDITPSLIQQAKNWSTALNDPSKFNSFPAQNPLASVVKDAITFHPRSTELATLLANTDGIAPRAQIYNQASLNNLYQWQKKGGGKRSYNGGSHGNVSSEVAIYNLGRLLQAPEHNIEVDPLGITLRLKTLISTPGNAATKARAWLTKYGENADFRYSEAAIAVITSLGDRKFINDDRKINSEVRSLVKTIGINALWGQLPGEDTKVDDVLHDIAFKQVFEIYRNSPSLPIPTQEGSVALWFQAVKEGPPSAASSSSKAPSTRSKTRRGSIGAAVEEIVEDVVEAGINTLEQIGKIALNKRIEALRIYFSYYPIEDARLLQVLMLYNVKPPYGYVGYRPSATYEMGCALAMYSTSKDPIGMTAYMPILMTVGEDPNNQTVHGQASTYTSALVPEPPRVFKIPDIFCKGYVKGNGDKAVDWYNPAQRSSYRNGDWEGDLVYTPRLMSWRCNQQPLDLTGVYHTDIPVTPDQANMCQYALSGTVCQSLGIKRYQHSPFSECFKDGEDSRARKEMNTLCFQACQKRYNPNDKSWSTVYMENGHWGNEVGDGCGTIRHGYPSIPKTYNYEKQNRGL